MNGKSRDPRRRRILIVDDQPIATHVLARLVGKHGYLAAEVNDPTKALRVAHKFQPDIAILDVHMPWKNGHEVAADFEADKLMREVPIIFMTADAVEQEASSKSVPVLLKPFSIDDLFALLDEATARKSEEGPETEVGGEILMESGAL